MSIERRMFLKYAAAGCACCVTPGLAAAADHAGPHWSYEGATGPDHWGDLSPEFKACGFGRQQTPIDLASRMKGEARLDVDYHPFPLRLANNGHTIEAAACGKCAITVDGTRYNLAQFHFHHPSEHHLDGVPFDMEVHMVHKSDAGNLAVVGVFMKEGAHNDALDVVFDHLPTREGTDMLAAGAFDPSVFLPVRRDAFRYMGSLTTPPCTEGLTWTVFHDPIEVSREQIRRFALLFPNNARPVQKKNDRVVESSKRT